MLTYVKFLFRTSIHFSFFFFCRRRRRRCNNINKSLSLLLTCVSDGMFFLNTIQVLFVKITIQKVQTGTDSILYVSLI